MDALDVLVTQGVVPAYRFGGKCGAAVSPGLLREASEVRLSGYKKLFEIDEQVKHTAVRRSIAGRKPVVIGLYVSGSFLDAGERWVPEPHEYQRYAGPSDTAHALTVIAYDDSLFGGAFEVMNSFGSSWGDEGFTWITYQDFDLFCFQGFELFFDRGSTPALEHVPSSPAAAAEGTTVVASAHIDFHFLPARQVVPLVRDERFTFEQPFRSGDLFRLVVSSGSDGYVYAFAADDVRREVVQIFPDPRRPTHPYILAGASICLPGPTPGFYSAFDSTAGKDLLYLIFSDHALDPAAMLRGANSRSGGVVPRLRSMLDPRDGVEVRLSVVDGKTAAVAAPRWGSASAVLFEFVHVQGTP
jgi:hypothetical protein